VNQEARESEKGARSAHDVEGSPPADVLLEVTAGDVTEGGSDGDREVKDREEASLAVQARHVVDQRWRDGCVARFTDPHEHTRGEHRGEIVRATREEGGDAPNEHTERHELRAEMGRAVSHRAEDGARQEVPDEERRRERAALKLVEIEGVLRLDARKHRREDGAIHVVQQV
jgi:hypothetical protein